MQKTELQIFLSKLKGFENPKPKLEQYQTSPEIASDMLNQAKLIGGENMIDLGAGTGILTIGAALLGFKAIGYEKD